MAEQQRERDIAEMEAQMAHDTDQYFEARPQIMRTRDKETTFEAGFKAAWAARPLSHAEGEAVDHWAVRNPGLADQFRAEAQAVRKRLGFESDADDVSPNDLRERIAEIEGAPQVAVPEQRGEVVATVRDERATVDRLNVDDLRRICMLPAGTKLYIHPAPQVAEEHIPVPRALVEHWANVDAFQAPKGAAMELKTIAQQMLVNFDAKAPKTAPRVAVPEGYALVPVDPNEEMLDAWFTAPQGDSGSVQGFATAYRAMLAAAPTAPAGELVTRCTAGLGCDEKGYCDAAATGQGDLCDRRTMAHERPVSDPDGLPEPGRREAEQAYINGAFDYARDPIGSRDWILFWNGWRARNKAAPAPDEREIAAKAIERATREYFSDESGPHNLHDYLLWRAKRLRAGKEGE